MAITLPLPLRVAAGLVATGIDLVKSLPEDIPALPVTLVGNAMRLSMKFQQEITTLATRGDELLGGVIGAPQENPPWAKFDDDEPAKPAPARPKAAATSDRQPKSDETKSPTRSKTTITPRSVSKPATVTDDEPGTSDATDTAGDHPLKTPTTTATAPADTTAMEAALEVSDALVEQALEVAEPDTEAQEAVETAANAAAGAADPGTGAADSDSPDVNGTDPAGVAETVPTVAAGATADAAAADSPAAERDIPADEPEADPTDEPVGQDDEPQGQVLTEAAIDGVLEQNADGPAALPGYSSMTLAQVRGHLRELSAADVGVLLRYEQDSDNRPPFLTLLSNRLVTLDAQNQ